MNETIYKCIVSVWVLSFGIFTFLIYQEISALFIPIFVILGWELVSIRMRGDSDATTT